MSAREAPITGKVHKKSSSGLTTIGGRRGGHGATTEINHFGELGTEASTFGQGDLAGSADASAIGDRPQDAEAAEEAPVSRANPVDPKAPAKSRAMRKRRAAPSA